MLSASPASAQSAWLTTPAPWQYTCPPGQGNIDFPATFRRLESAGYDGYYTMTFGSIADQLAARELVPRLRHLAPDAPPLRRLLTLAVAAGRYCWTGAWLAAPPA